MNGQDWLAERFEQNRARLRTLAKRMLGSADDAVQEAWLRLARSDADGIENLKGWLTTVVGRVCLDMLRSRSSRSEVSLDEPLEGSRPERGPEPVACREDGNNPEQEALVGDSVGPALLTVLETLSPVERVVFVLHDVFGVPFGEIAPVVGRSPNATKMLASRARRRVRGGGAAPDADLARQREVVDAFLAAAREGDFGALLSLLDPDVVLRSDSTAVRAGSWKEVRGARAVAETFSGRARAAQPALVDGAAGAAWAPGGRPRGVFGFTFSNGKIVGIEVIADRDRLGRLDLILLDG